MDNSALTGVPDAQLEWPSWPTPAQLSLIAPPTVRQMMMNAGLCLQYGEYFRSMEFCCSAIEGLLALRVESVTRSVRQQLPALDPGVRIVHTELGFRVELVRTEYGEQECASVLRYGLLLHNALTGTFSTDSKESHLIRCTITERFLLALQSFSRKNLVSCYPLSTRKAVLRAFLRLRIALERRLPSMQAVEVLQTRFLALLLHEPEQVARAILREFRFHSEYNFAKRHLHLHGLPGSQQYLESFVWPEKEDYIAYIAAQPGSRVLVTIHMGDFLGAFRCIAALANPRRGAISLRREQETDREKDYRVGERLDHKVLRHGQYNPISIVGALRKGDHTLAILFDLRDEFGETVAARFFGHQARFVKGPAQLAIMGKAPILPFVTFERNGCNHIELETVIDTRLLSAESLMDATSRITQQLVTLAEKWICRTPEQWKYLNSLPGYFERSADSPQRDDLSLQGRFE
ncbi:MAG: hypothetical protein Q8L60_14375 [Gammaproteobacteria bacterium]|nr:hypothetical protein [Gammaproteobacteria bacterium]MDP2139584.1 hypothetical protein [Gammaproteobacteria bacterium]MDP2346557.1 hypothetical protein [Gammaproteobacteria bacterium]